MKDKIVFLLSAGIMIILGLLVIGDFIISYKENRPINDPRTWMKACAIETLLKGKSGKHFKNCLIGKMQSTKAHIEDPAGYADELYNKIKGACS